MKSYYGLAKSADPFPEETFLTAVNDLTQAFPLLGEKPIMLNRPWIYEGAQGLLLDSEFGFFPHVTRSRTGQHGIQECETYPYTKSGITAYYVTRAYQTRHGNGPMTGTELTVPLQNTDFEINKSHAYQGEFRIRKLDLDAIRYAIESDFAFVLAQRNLVITCIDQVGEDIPVVDRGEEKLIHYSKIPEALGIRYKGFYISRSPYSDLLEQVV